MGNFRRMAQDLYFGDALRNTLLLTAIVVPLQLALALAMGLLLERLGRGRDLFFYFWTVPLGISDLAAGIVWLSIFTERGYLNTLLHALGVLEEPVGWLTYEHPTALFLAVVAAEVWRATPLVLVILVAGLQLIPRELHEAAEVFGATPWVRFRKVTLPLLLGAPAGYALARYPFFGRDLFRVFLILTRAFPIVVLALPLAVLFLRVGLYDTPLGVALVHTALTLPFSVMVSASLFLSIPKELEEAAWTLGCTRSQAFLKVVLPLALPGLAATAIFAFITSWNEVFAASVLTLQNKTLTAFLLSLLDESPLPFKFAGGFFLVVPALVFIFAVRRYLFTLWGIASR